jgi:hypothetical protein
MLVFFREILVVGTGAGDKVIKRGMLHRAIFAAPDIAVARYPFFVCKYCVLKQDGFLQCAAQYRLITRTLALCPIIYRRR